MYKNIDDLPITGRTIFVFGEKKESVVFEDIEPCIYYGGNT